MITELTVIILIAWPAWAALVLLAARSDLLRRVFVIPTTLAMIAVAVYLALSILILQPGATVQPLTFSVDSLWIDYLCIGVSGLLALYVIVSGIRHRKPLAVALAALQGVVGIGFELTLGHEAAAPVSIYIDSLSAIMILVIACIGGIICIYALGYMRDFQTHQNAHQPADKAPDDRRHHFFALIFVFLAAMFALVVSNKLTWMLTAWEMTSVCSFALIGYTRSEEAINNSFTAVTINLLGGLAFTLATILLAFDGIGELSRVVALGSTGQLLLPIALFAFAALTKAAQVPFQRWLLGAMVAPTPTSALLHSSTMVKAGVFLLLKLAPCFGWNTTGLMLMLVGGITFLFCSLMAIAQNNAKRVLAYSTVANLGLIVVCAGVGSPEAIWAGLFLLVFHAAAKALLFCCVGTAEHHIGSRDIEAMDEIFERLPRLARLMALGILIMFVAPFGMLVSKWATLVSLADSGNVNLLLLLAFGSAATFMFWTKWLGKVLAVAVASHSADEADAKNKAINKSERVSLAILALFAVALCLSFPWLSQWVVLPYLQGVGAVISGAAASAWLVGVSAISFDNLIIMAVIVAVLLLIFICFLGRSKKRQVPIYLSGVGLNSHKRDYRDSLSGETVASQRNWYMESWFGEKSLQLLGEIVCCLVLAAGMIFACLSLLGWSL